MSTTFSVSGLDLPDEFGVDLPEFDECAIELPLGVDLPDDEEHIDDDLVCKGVLAPLPFRLTDKSSFSKDTGVLLQSQKYEH